MHIWKWSLIVCVCVYSDCGNEGFSRVLLTCWLAFNDGEFVLFLNHGCFKLFQSGNVLINLFTKTLSARPVSWYWSSVFCVFTVLYDYVHRVCVFRSSVASLASLLLAWPSQDPVLDWRCNHLGHVGEGSVLLWVSKHQIQRRLQLGLWLYLGLFITTLLFSGNLICFYFYF